MQDEEKMEEGSNGEMSVEQGETQPSRCARLKAFLLKWHLPIFLLIALLFGYFVPVPGAFLNELNLGGICFEGNCVWNSIGSLCVTLIFFISGTKLKTDEIKNALSAWKAASYGIFSILFITPCMSYAMINVPFAIAEFSLGLALFFSMPTTLSSGPIITGQAKGNIALALLLTVFTNIIGVFTMPLFVTSFLQFYEVPPQSNSTDSAEDVNISLDPLPIILKLIFIVLVPLAVGKALRFFDFVCRFVKRHKVGLKLASSFLLAMVPWMKVSSSADDFSSIDAASFFAMFFMGLLVHLVYLVFNWVAATVVIKLEEPERRAVIIVASQKTLPVAITVLELLPQQLVGSPGLVAIPIICAHFVQIVIDAFIASYWGSKPDPLGEDDSVVETGKSPQQSGKDKLVEGGKLARN